MYAYVFCMFLGDAYLPGVLVMAYSIFNTGTPHDVVCMVTPDVSEDAKNKMKSIGIKVVNVEYIYTNTYFDERPDLKRRYPQMDKFSTKWNCLKLVQYEKIFFLDVDMIVQKNMDHIFKLPTPATRLAFQTHTNEDGKKKAIISVLVMNDGDAIPMDIANRVLNDKLGAIDGGCMLLTPDIKQYEKFLIYAKTFDPRKFNFISGDDELVLFIFYHSQNTKWHYLGIEWSCIQWKYSGACTSENSYIVNYLGIDKPWAKDLSHYPDLKVWYENCDRFKKKYPGLITLNFNNGNNNKSNNNKNNNNKSNFNKSKFNNKKGGYIGTRTSIYVIFIIILLFLYFIYVYQENIYSVIYNGRNTLCNSVYPSICIFKG